MGSRTSFAFRYLLREGLISVRTIDESGRIAEVDATGRTVCACSRAENRGSFMVVYCTPQAAWRSSLMTSSRLSGVVLDMILALCRTNVSRSGTNSHDSLRTLSGAFQLDPPFADVVDEAASQTARDKQILSMNSKDDLYLVLEPDLRCSRLGQSIA